MCYNSLQSLLSLVNLQIEMASLPELIELRRTQVRSQLALERATERISDQLVEKLTGPEQQKMADIKSASELISLAESMKIDSTGAKEKLAQIINSELESILLKYQKA